jgi:hypothetical protein
MHHGIVIGVNTLLLDNPRLQGELAAEYLGQRPELTCSQPPPARPKPQPSRHLHPRPQPPHPNIRPDIDRMDHSHAYPGSDYRCSTDDPMWSPHGLDRTV